MEYIQADIWVRFQRMQGHEVHFVCADDTHGAPIMLKAESEGITPEQLIARVAESHVEDWRRYRHQLRHDAFDALAGERRARAVDLPQAARPRAVADRREDDRAVLRPGQGHVPRRPLHQGHVPEVRREGPVRRRVRSLRHDVRADRPHRPVFGAHRREAGAARSPSTCSSACRTRRSSRSSSAGRRTTPLQPEVFNKIQEWLGDGRRRRRSTTGTSRATRRISASRFPTRPASISTSGSTRRSATSRR